MPDLVTLPLAGLAGAVLGALFFAGLWWTVQKGLTSRQPAAWFLSSLVVRTALLLAGFYFVARGRWERALACLIGFALARWVATLKIRTSAGRQTLGKEVGHAPQPR